MLGLLLRQLSTLARLTSRQPRKACGTLKFATHLPSVTSPGITGIPQTVSLACARGEPGLVDENRLAAFLADRTFDRSQRVLTIFVRELNEKISRLQQSINLQDPATLRQVVHAAQGSSMLVGAVRLAQESKSVELQLLGAGQPDWDAAAQLKLTMARSLEVYETLLANNLALLLPVLGKADSDIASAHGRGD